MKQTGLLTKDTVVNTTMAQFGESSNYIESQNKANGSNLSVSSLRNVPLLNMKKSEKSGGAMSGGAMSGGARSGGCPSNLRNFV